MQLNEIKNSKVLVRVCFDLPDLSQTSRIKDSVPTVDLLQKNHNTVILLTHWGRPKNFNPELSTQNLLSIVSEIFNQKVIFIDQFRSFTKAKNIIDDNQGKLILLENTRFSSAEKSKIEAERRDLSEKYSSLANFFVDEAFAVSHRKEVTNYDVKKLIPSFYGLSFQTEIDNLNKIKKNPKKPFSVIMGGSKLETKLFLIQDLLLKADNIFLAGRLAFTFIEAGKKLGIKDCLQIDYGSSSFEAEFLETAKSLIQKFRHKINLPVDFIYGDDTFNLIPIEELTAHKRYFAYDCGFKTINAFFAKLKDSSTIFWNGPLGVYEKPPFERSTQLLGKKISNLKNTYKVLGGGDILAALNPGVVKKFDFASMGGGATLHYLAE